MALCVLTGASRGFGASLALTFAKGVPDCDFLLVSLCDSADTLRAMRPHLSAGRTASHLRIDLAEADTVTTAVGDALQKLPLPTYRRTFLLHNAGSLGPLTLLADAPHADLRRALDLNVTSFLLLTGVILHLCPPGPDRLVRVANVSSLLALQPQPGLGVYCVIKAARDMAIAVLAREHPEHAQFLSYAPGPMPTAMFDTIRTSVSHEGTRQAFAAMSQTDLVDPSASAACLLKYLLTGSFASGSHVDFYDEHPFGASTS